MALGEDIINILLFLLIHAHFASEPVAVP